MVKIIVKPIFVCPLQASNTESNYLWTLLSYGVSIIHYSLRILWLEFDFRCLAIDWLFNQNGWTMTRPWYKVDQCIKSQRLKIILTRWSKVHGSRWIVWHVAVSPMCEISASKKVSLLRQLLLCLLLETSIYYSYYSIEIR